MLLIAGGLLDPSLQALADAAEALGVEWLDWRVPQGVSPPCHWDLSSEADELPWGDAGQGAAPTGAFLRQDVFAALGDPRSEVAQRALGWFVAVQGWLMAHPGIRTFNAEMSAVALNKPAALLRARQAGLRIPPTWVSNDTARMRSRLSAPAIAKPVAGGGLCQTLEDALAHVTADHSAMPALVQPRLVSPEFRVFVVGGEVFAFKVSSPSLDYRATQDAEVEAVPAPAESDALQALMRDFRMDFGAADFKTDPDTGDLVFLELNTSPMFVRFDQACEGKLTRHMVATLLQSSIL